MKRRSRLQCGSSLHHTSLSPRRIKAELFLSLQMKIKHWCLFNILTTSNLLKQPSLELLQGFGAKPTWQAHPSGGMSYWGPCQTREGPLLCQLILSPFGIFPPHGVDCMSQVGFSALWWGFYWPLGKKHRVVCQWTVKTGRLTCPSNIWLDTPTCDVTVGTCRSILDNLE